jgi:hypothetical protein
MQTVPTLPGRTNVPVKMVTKAMESTAKVLFKHSATFGTLTFLQTSTNVRKTLLAIPTQAAPIPAALILVSATTATQETALVALTTMSATTIRAIQRQTAPTLSVHMSALAKTVTKAMAFHVRISTSAMLPFLLVLLMPTAPTRKAPTLARVKLDTPVMVTRAALTTMSAVKTHAARTKLAPTALARTSALVRQATLEMPTTTAWMSTSAMKNLALNLLTA